MIRDHRLSLASALSLGYKKGRMYRDAQLNCINLLQAFDDGCKARCTYCGLAEGNEFLEVENHTFIRVEWPLRPFTDIVERMRERQGGFGRVCLSMLQHPHGFADALEATRELKREVDLPVSVLASATLLNEEKLLELRDAGADMIGFGLDAASERVFETTRGKGVRGPHRWDYHWAMIDAARRVFGPWKVNCHLMVGLGETDRELLETTQALTDREIFSYLFCFNPEPGSRMADVPKPPMRRWRRIQLAKHLIEQGEGRVEQLSFDLAGDLISIGIPAETIEAAVSSGRPFLTNGCPDRHGEVACNRPFGSYRPGEPFRDFPFHPNADDLAQIRAELALHEIVPGCRVEAVPTVTQVGD